MNAVEKVRAQIPLLAKGDMHYLDNAATALMPAPVIQAMADYDDQTRGNIGRGLHRFAEAADAAYEKARFIVADYLGVQSKEIIFTGGATAALNMLIAALSQSLGKKDAVLLSVAEHHSNIVPWQIAAAQKGFSIRFIPLNQNGEPDLESAQKELAKKDVRVLSVCHASNVTGVISDLPKLAAAARENGALVVVDGAQFAPHESPPLNAKNPPADFYVFSGHKCHAANGIGVLWGRHECLAKLPTVVGGGGSINQVREDGFDAADSPRRFEAGTPPITQAVGLGAALQWLTALPRKKIQSECHSLAMTLADGLAQIKGVRLLFAHSRARRVPIVSFVMAGAHPHDICEWLASRHVAVRGGHLCAQPLMRHLQINTCVRASISAYNTADDMQAMLTAVQEAANALR